MKKSNALMLMAASTIFVACENPMETMKTMKDTTSKMSTTTEGMQGTTRSMKDNMLIMHDQVRIKEARDTRDKEMAALLSSSNGIAKKLLHAGIFFKSMEYQLWTGNDELDSVDKRDVLILDAVKEFIRVISDIHGRIKANKLSPLAKMNNKNNDEFAFIALATAMHENNHYQEELHKKNKKFELLSFYDIVKKAIAKEEAGGELKEYELELLSIRNILDDIIDARVNMLTALGVKNLADQESVKKGKGLLFKISGGKLGDIIMDSNFEESTYAVKKDILKKLDAAVLALEFAQENKINVSLDKTLKSLIENLVVEEANDTDSNEDRLLKVELKELLEKLKKVESK